MAAPVEILPRRYLIARPHRQIEETAILPVAYRDRADAREAVRHLVAKRGGAIVILELVETIGTPDEGAAA